MRFALTQKVLTFALAATAAIPVLVSGEVGTLFVVVFWGLFAGGWMLPQSIAETPQYRRTLTWIIVGVFALQLVRLGLGAPMAMLGMEFTTFLLGMKLISRAHASDDNQIVILSFLHIIAATVVMTNIVYGIAFLVFVTLSSPMLALSYLRQEIENRFAPRSGREKNPEMIGRLFNSKRIVSLKFLFGSALLTVPILIITGVLFLLFPRIGLGFMGTLSHQKTTVGFGKEVVLGDMDVVRLENTVVMRLTPAPKTGRSADRLDIKIRGAVFDKFDGERWQKSITPLWRQLHSDSGVYVLNAAPSAESAPRYDVLLEAMDPKLVFVPEGTGSIETAPSPNRAGPDPHTLEANFFGEIRYRDPAGIGLRYSVTLDGAALTGAPPVAEVAYKSLYPGSRRLEELAVRMAGQGTPAEKAQRLVRGLKSRYAYAFSLSKDARNRREASPLNRFLFARKTGTCEHFATALTLMLRAVDIPARLVTGFSGADWNDIGEFYSVRKRYAHSWTEAFIAGRWRTLDATPSAQDGESVLLRPSLLSRVVDALRMQWQAHIIGYNLTTQGKLALRLWRYGKRHHSVTGDLFRGVPGGIVVIVIGALFLGGLWAVLRRRRGRRSGRPASDPAPVITLGQKEAVSLLARVERRLAKLGYRRSPDQTPLEYLRTVEADAPFSLDDAFTVLDRYNAVRFGRSTFAPKEMKHLRARIQTIGARPKTETWPLDPLGN